MKTTKLLASVVVIFAVSDALAFGERDPTFSTQLPSELCQGNSTALLVGQDLLLSYLLPVTSANRGGLVRLRADGTLDTAWGNGGRAEWPNHPDVVAPRQVLRLADGGFLLVGEAAVRFSAGGVLDLSYGDRGQSARFSPSLAGFHSAALQPDGRIVALMQEGSPSGMLQWVFRRLDPNGSSDETFGDHGQIRAPIDSFRNIPFAWGVQSDGKVQLATYRLEREARLPAEIHRYPDDFGPDERVGGQLMPRGVSGSWISPRAAVDARGRTVLTGSCSTADGCDPANLVIARFDAAGQPDASFGDAGRALFAAPGPGPKFISGPKFIIPRDTESLTPHTIWLARDGAITVFASHFAFRAGRTEDNSFRALRFTDAGVLNADFPNYLAIGGTSPDALAFGGRSPDLMRLPQLDDGRFLLWSGADSSGAGCMIQRRMGDHSKANATLVEYEYRGRYFVTAEGPESVLLDNDPAAEKLRRTGRTFGGWLPQAQLEGSLPLCRFYGDPIAGPRGHFYSLQGTECDLVRADDARLPIGTRTWRFEGLAFSEAPARAAGTCAPNLQPVYRLFNDRIRLGGDPNHRFTTDPAVIAEMQAQGWILEGVAFCAPLSSP